MAAAAAVPVAPMSPSSPSGPRSLPHPVRELKPLSCVLHIARSLADHLSRLHTAGVIYKALRPSSVLFNADTGRVVLLEYHASSLLSRERPFTGGGGGGWGGRGGRRDAGLYQPRAERAHEPRAGLAH